MQRKWSRWVRGDTRRQIVKKYFTIFHMGVGGGPKTALIQPPSYGPWGGGGRSLNKIKVLTAEAFVWPTF